MKRNLITYVLVKKNSENQFRGFYVFRPYFLQFEKLRYRRCDVIKFTHTYKSNVYLNKLLTNTTYKCV